MSRTSALDRPAPTEVDVEVDHIYCCDYDLALCGVDISDQNECPLSCADHPECVVCADLYNGPCGDPNCPVVGA